MSKDHSRNGTHIPVTTNGDKRTTTRVQFPNPAQFPESRAYQQEVFPRGYRISDGILSTYDHLRAWYHNAYNTNIQLLSENSKLQAKLDDISKQLEKQHKATRTVPDVSPEQSEAAHLDNEQHTDPSSDSEEHPSIPQTEDVDSSQVMHELERTRKRLQESEASVSSLESQLRTMQSQLDEANRGFDRSADDRLRARRDVIDVELNRRLAEERAGFELGLKQFQVLDEGMREALREETIKSRREITDALDETIRGIESVREGMVQSLSDYLQELYLHDFDSLAIFIQYYFKALAHLDDVSTDCPENSELAKTLAQFESLRITLENACGEIGLSFVWADSGESFKAGTEHDLLDENDIPTGIEDAEFVIQKCVAPGISHKLRGGREKTIRRPIVTVIKGEQYEQ